MFPAPTTKDQLMFNLSQRDNEIQILRQRVSALTEDRKLLCDKLEREMLEGNRLREEVRRLMTPPQTSASEDVWDDVTHECVVTAGSPQGRINRRIYHYRPDGQYIEIMQYEHLHEYRIRQKNDWRNGMTALIIERKRS